MSMANQWVGWGNLTRDPEIRYFESGTSVANCGFFDLAIWADQGENVAGSLSKGDRVMVVGNLRIRRVEDPGGGAARQYPEVVVEEIGPTMRFATVDISKTPKKAKPSSSDPSHANF